mmetsp:Transcript_2393/g.6922  ORF Transcript_2393/g.6922 Transcript_2393/m.6922 type:complete len:276 (-) Transcript_2393:339-1166(-)
MSETGALTNHQVPGVGFLLVLCKPLTSQARTQQGVATSLRQTLLGTRWINRRGESSGTATPRSALAEPLPDNLPRAEHPPSDRTRPLPARGICIRAGRATAPRPATATLSLPLSSPLPPQPSQPPEVVRSRSFPANRQAPRETSNLHRSVLQWCNSAQQDWHRGASMFSTRRRSPREGSRIPLATAWSDAPHQHREPRTLVEDPVLEVPSRHCALSSPSPHTAWHNSHEETHSAPIHPRAQQKGQARTTGSRWRQPAALGVSLPRGRPREGFWRR